MGAVKLGNPWDGLRDEAVGRTFPRSVLRGCETGLCLFAAGFLGRQDAVWMADAGLKVTCVDHDEPKLRQMMDLYPDSWSYRAYDVFEYVTTIRQFVVKFDVVTVDCPSNMFGEAVEYLPEFCELALRAVVLGSTPTEPIQPPVGWKVTQERKRSDYVPAGVYWTVLEKA